MVVHQLLKDHPGHHELNTILDDMASYYYHQGFAAEKAGDSKNVAILFDSATTYWQWLVETQPVTTETPQAYFFAAETYHRLGHYEQAISHYQKLLDNWPQHPKAWHVELMIGRSYQQLGRNGGINLSQANRFIQTHYQKLCQRYPDSPAARIASAWLDQKGLAKGGRL